VAAQPTRRALAAARAWAPEAPRAGGHRARRQPPADSAVPLREARNPCSHLWMAGPTSLFPRHSQAYPGRSNQGRRDLQAMSRWPASGMGLVPGAVGSERCLTSGSEQLDVAVHPGLRPTGGRRDLPCRPALDQDRSHGVERQIHGDTSSPAVPEMVRHGVPETLGPKTPAATTPTWVRGLPTPVLASGGAPIAPTPAQVRSLTAKCAIPEAESFVDAKHAWRASSARRFENRRRLLGAQR
jgi:hypothetical protein